MYFLQPFFCAVTETFSSYIGRIIPIQKQILSEMLKHMYGIKRDSLMRLKQGFAGFIVVLTTDC